LAERYGISKQAISADIIAAIARLAKIDPSLARELVAAREFYRHGLSVSIAPKFKIVSYAIPRSRERGEFSMMHSGKTFLVALEVRGGKHVAIRADGRGGEIEGPFEWCLEESATGTMRGEGWLRVAR